MKYFLYRLYRFEHLAGINYTVFSRTYNPDITVFALFSSLLNALDCTQLHPVASSCKQLQERNSNCEKVQTTVVLSFFQNMFTLVKQ